MRACNFLTRSLILDMSSPHSELQVVFFLFSFFLVLGFSGFLVKKEEQNRIGVGLFSQIIPLRTLTPGNVTRFSSPPNWRVSRQIYVGYVLNYDFFLMPDLSEPFICYCLV